MVSGASLNLFPEYEGCQLPDLSHLGNQQEYVGT